MSGELLQVGSGTSKIRCAQFARNPTKSRAQIAHMLAMIAVSLKVSAVTTFTCTVSTNGCKPVHKGSAHSTELSGRKSYLRLIQIVLELSIKMIDRSSSSSSIFVR